MKYDVISCQGEWIDEGVIRLSVGDFYHDFNVEGCDHMSSVDPRSYLVAVDFDVATLEDQLIAFSPFSLALPTSQWRALY